MHEKTFLGAIMALDVMLILAGASMAWGYGTPASHSSAGDAAVMMGLIVVVGGWSLYQVNIWIFNIAESTRAHFTPRIVAISFAIATLAGGLIGFSAR